MQAVVLTPEEQERADGYALLAALLLGPEPELLDALADAEPPPAAPGELAQAWSALLEAAARTRGRAKDEFEALFVAVGTPLVNPYECRYVAGWLMDKPLAQLRQDLKELGIARAPSATELEDHIGALFEAMRMLVERPAPPADQQRFFARHLSGWTRRCLDDIAAAPGADFYRAVVRLAAAFLAAEAQTLGVDEPDSTDSPPSRKPSDHDSLHAT